MDLLKPDNERQVLDKQSTQKEAYDKHSNVREFEVGDLVMVRNYRDKHVTWLPGSITKKLGQVTFVVILNNGSQRKSHIDQIRRREASYTSETNVNDQGTDVQSEDSDSSTDVETAVIPDSKTTIQNSITNDYSSPLNEETDNDRNVDEVTNTDRTSSSSLRYPKRNRKPPDRFT